jgi:hypothetical protein
VSHDVFISHSSADKRVADAACSLLEARGIVGLWKTPLLTFVTGSHIVFLYTPGTFEFKADQTYVLHLTRTQTGTLKATNGIYTLTSGLLSAQGNYRFEGSDTFVDTQGRTTSIWKRQ